ncbi:hypothetical protein G6011_04573 [Alternaria panax]|uniref:RNA polymerase I-specific transcription initiation factor RRN6-like protein n=1 Tax=Alternaria panax TaxID=48097 RepID=A0AAD4IGS3_9PLEO|nr:hypothetical protein G6011_04573 [Alternaria panax]
MADRSLKDLNYGHPGVASYNLGNREWAFARQYTRRCFKQIRNPDSTPSNSHATPASTQTLFPDTPANRTSIQEEIGNTVEDHPLLAPAAGLIPDLALVSAAISSAASTYDPLVGDLLSFGFITPKGTHEAWRMAALPTGETGSILQLCVLDNERHDWTNDPKSWVQGQTLKGAESVFWNEEAAPIQQVCFLRSEDRPLLAVRLPTRTVLFHPDYHHQPRAAAASPFYHLPASTIQSNPILSIHQNDTGGFPHVDVASNPDFQLQFALVDQSQTWSVWDIEHRLRLGTYTASCVLRGRINESEDGDTTGQDGWARILWVADITTLLVCNRRHLSIVSIKGESTSYLPCSKIFSERSADWILDVKRHPKDRSRVFVLTSTRLILIAVTAPSEHLSGADETGAKILLSWRHYRGAEDFTLGLSVQMLADDETCLMIHSRVNNLVQIYSCVERFPGLVTGSDPSMLDLSIPGSGHITDIFMEPMQQGDLRSEADLFQLFVMQSDLSVHELVVCTQASTTVDMTNDHAITDFTRSTITRPRDLTLKSRTANRDDEFLCPDGLANTELPYSKAATLWSDQYTSSNKSTALEIRNNGLLGDVILRSMILAEKSGAIDAVTVMDQVNEMLATGANLPSVPLGTLMEFTRMHLDVTDIDEASSNFQELFSSGYGYDTLDVQRIAPMHVLDLTHDGDPTISDVYDTILQTWVAPLPVEVPIRIRQRLERLARRVATELMFSSTCIRDDRRRVSTTTQRAQNKGGVALPILPSRPKDGALHPISQPLPTPPYSSIPPSSLPPSSVLGSSPPEAPSTPPALPDSLSRLSKYLPTSKDATIIHPNVTQCLAHWQLGSDPHTYNWASLERALQSEDLDEESQQKREKERKKRERREKRQQRENELMKAKLELMRSKAVSQPIIFARSSPGPFGGLRSSQVPGQSESQSQVPSHSSSFMMPQSQVERGKFGGKLDKKKKKKGRISGF